MVLKHTFTKIDRQAHKDACLNCSLMNATIAYPCFFFFFFELQSAVSYILLVLSPCVTTLRGFLTHA